MTLFEKQALKNEHVLITGATGGIGYETAILLSKMGAKVTITGRNTGKLQALESKLYENNKNAEVFLFPADLAVQTELEALIKEATNKFGEISLLVNSAGIMGGDLVEDMDAETLEKVMHLNYTVPVMLSKQVYKDMKKNKRGAIVNVSSLSGLRGTYGGTAYCGSKFALIGFTQRFALEAIENGVRVNAVCPGFVDTEMGRTAIANKGKRSGNSFEEQLKIVNEGLPSSRITEPEEVANTIAFLLTEAARNIIGESVKISGGSVMR